MRLKGILLVLLIASMFAVIPTPVQAQTFGPHMDYLHIINYGNPDLEFAALENEEIDITDWPLDAFFTNKWVIEGRVPDEITLDPYAEIGSYETDINCGKWPTGCDGVAAREGYSGTFTNASLGKTWNQFHTRQRPLTSNATAAPSYTSPPTPGTMPMGNGSDYDPETDSWKTYFDEDCLWCTMSWGLRLAIAFKMDKDWVISDVLEGLGEKMITWAAAPAHHGIINIANLTFSSFTYYGPHGSVNIPSLVFDYGLSRAQMDVKADELFQAAGFSDWDGDGTRNDPRKVAGADKTYGTGDDVKTAASNMDSLIFYIRLDDPDRRAMGEKLSADLQASDVPVDEKVMEKTVCFKNVMVDYAYHLYTGGYSFGADPQDIQYGLFHSSQFWYPVGWAGGYQAWCNVEADEYIADVRFSPNRVGPGGWLPGMKNATYLENKYVCSIPVWSSASSNAYRTGWDGVVNHAGYGTTWGTGGAYYWSLFNMEPTPGGPYDPDDTINVGFKAAPEDLSMVTSEWVWDYIVLDAMYESLLVRNPYNLGEERGMLAQSWSEGVYEGDKKYIDFVLKSGVKFHDGSTMTAGDVKWSIEFMRDCGPGVAWQYATLKNIRNVTVLVGGDGGTVRFYMESGSAWALHDAGFLEILNPAVWKAADTAIGWGYNETDGSFVDVMKVREYHPHEDDYYPGGVGDGTLDLAQDGTGPWKFVGVTGIWEFIDLEAFRDHHLSQSEVADYLNNAFHEIGSVNYPGSVHQADYIAGAMGVDNVIDVSPDLLLIERASATTPMDPAGIQWDEWNVDADINSDNIVDALDYGTANLNLLKTAG